MLLHYSKLIFFAVSDNLLNNVFDCLNKMLEFHLVGIELVPHDFDENEVVVIFGDLFGCHPRKPRQLSELGGS